MEHLKPPEALILSTATNKAEAWRRWKMSWDLYKVASGLDQKDEKIQVATLLHVLGKECVEIFSNFVWDSEDDRDKIEAVEEKFKAHCAPLNSRHFNRYLFIERKVRKVTPKLVLDLLESVSCLVGCVGKGIKYVFKWLMEITCPSG